MVVVVAAGGGIGGGSDGGRGGVGSDVDDDDGGGAAMGLSVDVDSAMFSMEQKGVDVVGVEKNRPLSLSPTLADEPGGGGTRRSGVEESCEGGGVGGGVVVVVETVVIKRAGLSASRIEATAVVDDGKRTGKMLDTGLRSESSDKAKM